MSRRRLHYERAFESLLRTRAIPHITVDEAHKALMQSPDRDQRLPSPSMQSLKSFDFIISGDTRNLLVDVKGRKIGRGSHLESWVTLEDVESLTVWQRLFGADFEAGFIFMYWCDRQPPDALFQDIMEDRGRWYAMRHVALADYTRHMRTRSAKWGTVHVPGAAFERISRPFMPTRTPRVAAMAG
jgi:hypothetical protein